MKLTINIDLDNAAFEDHMIDELGRVLRSCVSKTIEQLERPDSLCDHPEAADKLLDLNGNTVGSIQLRK